jgi:hypothetical protein
MRGHRAQARPPQSGRHRLGRPGLRHCRELEAVRSRLAADHRTHRAARTTTVRRTGRLGTLLMAAVGTGAVLISGWYTAAGASAIAQMVGP